jgi:hypothetical protein
MTELATQQANLARVTRLCEQIVTYLAEWPGDYAGAAKKAGTTRETVIQLYDRYPELFNDIEDQYYDRLTSLCKLVAMGKSLPHEFEHFDFNAAKIILQWRQKELSEVRKQTRKSKQSNEPLTFEIGSETQQILEEKLKLITPKGDDNGQS